MYLEFYEEYQKGTVEEFENLEWINNEFYDGTFLDTFNMGFSAQGHPFSYNITDHFDMEKEQIVDWAMNITKEYKDEFELRAGPEETFNVIEFLSWYFKEDIVNFRYDIDTIFGEFSPGDVKDSNEILEEIKLKKQEQQEQAKKAEEGNKDPKSESETPPDITEEITPEEDQEAGAEAEPDE